MARRAGVAAQVDPQGRAAVAVPATGIHSLPSRDAGGKTRRLPGNGAFDPAVGWTRHCEIDGNPVGRGSRPVAPWPWTIRTLLLPSPLDQGGVELDRSDPAGWPDQLGQDRAVIAGARADMSDVPARCRAERLDELWRRATGCDC
jgi:hypothetical protein